MPKITQHSFWTPPYGIKFFPMYYNLFNKINSDFQFQISKIKIHFVSYITYHYSHLYIAKHSHCQSLKQSFILTTRNVYTILERNTVSRTFLNDAGATTEKQIKNTSVCGYESDLSLSKSSCPDVSKSHSGNRLPPIKTAS